MFITYIIIVCPILRGPGTPIGPSIELEKETATTPPLPVVLPEKTLCILLLSVIHSVPLPPHTLAGGPYSQPSPTPKDPIPSPSKLWEEKALLVCLPFPK